MNGQWPARSCILLPDHGPLEYAINRRVHAVLERITHSRLDERIVLSERLLVSVVDDDESVRESLPAMLRQLGFAAEAFSSAEAFLASSALNETSCLILDIAMPGMSGPDLQQELLRRQQQIPIVFITARGDESVRRDLLARGAVECLFKPFSKTALIDALNTARGKR